jgi:DNA-binding response OmpR family regulator
MHKILIVEEDADMALALALPLEATGYGVTWAASGQEGLRQVLERAPDLLILDATMETNAADCQVSLALRNPDARSPYAQFRDPPILMLTAPHTTMALRFGPDEAYLPVNDFVEKPVDPDILLAKVRALLAGR